MCKASYTFVFAIHFKDITKTNKAKQTIVAFCSWLGCIVFCVQVVHPTLARTHMQRRLQMMEKGSSLDWAAAEALAFGSLLYQGMTIYSSWDIYPWTWYHTDNLSCTQVTPSWKKLCPKKDFFNLWVNRVRAVVSNNVLIDEYLITPLIYHLYTNPFLCAIYFGEICQRCQT